MKFSQKVATAFWASFIAMIVIETLYFQPWMNSSEYMFLSAVFLSIFALGWVLADSSENGIEIPKLLNICVVIAAFLAVPYYRFRYFGAKPGFVFLGIVGLNLAGLVFAAAALDYLSVRD